MYLLFHTSFMKWVFSQLRNLNLYFSLKISNLVVCIMLLLIIMVDGKLMLLMISFLFMNKVENQFGGWICNSHGKLFSSNCGLKDFTFLPNNTNTISLQRVVILEFGILLHLILSIVLQTVTGNL